MDTEGVQSKRYRNCLVCYWWSGELLSNFEPSSSMYTCLFNRYGTGCFLRDSVLEFLCRLTWDYISFEPTCVEGSCSVSNKPTKKCPCNLFHVLESSVLDKNILLQQFHMISIIYRVKTCCQNTAANRVRTVHPLKILLFSQVNFVLFNRIIFQLNNAKIS